jgi:hypothetical protein
MKKILFVLLIGAGLILISLFLTMEKDFPLSEENEDENEEEAEEVSQDFIECLKEEGVMIYGSSTCSACEKLREEYGGYSVLKPIYLDCSQLGSEEDFKKCIEEMKTGYVPEVQINGEVFKQWGSPENLAEETGCPLN